MGPDIQPLSPSLDFIQPSVFFNPAFRVSAPHKYIIDQVPMSLNPSF